MLRLTTERQAQKLSKAALSRLARIDQALMSKIEAGRMMPYPVELRRIAEALEWPPADADRLLEDLDNTEGRSANGAP